MSAFVVREATAADAPGIRRLFARVFGREMSEEEWTWKFERNPDGWYGVVAPSRTPYDTVVRLSVAIAQLMSTPAMRARIASQGAEPAMQTPEAFAEHLHAEIAKWAKVAKAAGVAQETQ